MSLFAQGFQFMFGALLAILAGFVLLSIGSSNRRDDSDPAGGHSGLKVLTDHRTGLQYLSVQGGGLYPRLGHDGRQLLEGEDAL